MALNIFIKYKPRAKAKMCFTHHCDVHTSACNGCLREYGQVRVPSEDNQCHFRADGAAWRETWREAIAFDQANGEPIVERSAHKWARDGKACALLRILFLARDCMLQTEANLTGQKLPRQAMFAV